MFHHCLNGNSECPKRNLDSTISVYVRRALTHCSNWKDTHQELERITQVLVNNGYANSDVSRTIKKWVDKWYTERKETERGETIKIYYRGHMSTDYKTEEKTMKNIIYRNVRPTDENSRIIFTIYYKIRKTSQLLLRPLKRTMSFTNISAIVRNTGLTHTLVWHGPHCRGDLLAILGVEPSRIIAQNNIAAGWLAKTSTKSYRQRTRPTSPPVPRSHTHYHKATHH